MQRHSQGGGVCSKNDPPEFWCGYCYSNLRGRSNFKGHRAFRSRPVVRSYWSLSCMKRPTESSKPVKGKIEVADTSWSKSYPTVTAYMCDAFWEDGKSRECASVSIRMEGSQVNLSLSDHAMQRSCFTTATSVAEALQLLEDALRTDRVTWRSWKSGKK